MAYALQGLAALADPTRRTIFERVAEHPRAVVELARDLPISRPAVSQHLKVLKAAGLVIDRPQGNRRIYSADPEALAELRAYFDEFWNTALASLKAIAEGPEQEDQMSTPSTDTAVHASIVVEVPIEHAFRVFTQQFDRIKPREHNMLAVDIEETVLEPRAGGRIYDRGADGSECSWARVLAFEPPQRIVFSWDIGPRWQVEADLDNASEVEVRFIADTPERTRVELEHRHLDRHGADWDGLREGVGGDQGWPLYLRRFAELSAEGR